MYSRTTTLGLAGLLGAALLAAGCSEPVGPSRGALDAPRFAVTAGGIALDQQNGTLNERGTMLIKGFNTTNPHVGDAIIATFFWTGSTNIIDSVTDVLTTTSYPRVGNTYTLVEYVTSVASRWRRTSRRTCSTSPMRTTTRARTASWP